VCAITDFRFAIPENELCFAQADVCPSPEMDLQAILENPDNTKTFFTPSRNGAPVTYFSANSLFRNTLI
jgi:hypothetical protein